MYSSAARHVVAIVIAATGIYLGVRLAIYADADDAPGGIVIGALLALGSLALGSWIALHREQSAEGDASAPPSQRESRY